MCVCVCVCVCVCFGNISSLMNIALNNIDMFGSIRRELVDETPITNSYPSIFCLILGHHQGCVYCKNDVTFAYTLQLSVVYLYLYVVLAFY